MLTWLCCRSGRRSQYQSPITSSNCAWNRRLSRSIVANAFEPIRRNSDWKRRARVQKTKPLPISGRVGLIAWTSIKGVFQILDSKDVKISTNIKPGADILISPRVDACNEVNIGRNIEPRPDVPSIFNHVEWWPAQKPISAHQLENLKASVTARSDVSGLWKLRCRDTKGCGRRRGYGMPML